MLILLGTALNITAPSPITKRREYEAYLRGPVGAITARFGSRERFWAGAQHLRGLNLPEPSESFANDFGIVDGGTTTATLTAPTVDEDGIAATLLTLQTTIREAMVDLHLVTRRYREDGTSVEFVNERRARVKSATRKQSTLSLELVDVDRSALEATLPVQKYSTGDFPKMLAAHVGRVVPQFVGTARKVPLTYIDNDGVSNFRYSPGEWVGGILPKVLTVYRNGRVVDATEYTMDTVAVHGRNYVRINFTKEQIDFGGAPYELAADMLGGASRAASDEVKRILLLLGATVDGPTFDAAGPYCIANNMYVDGAYAQERQGIAILQDLLQIARGQLYRKANGDYAIFIDRPRECRLRFEDATDDIAVDQYTYPQINKTITLEYMPATPDGSSYVGKLSRTTNGTAGETSLKNQYIGDYTVADRLLAYLQARENAKRTASATAYGIQMNIGDLIAIRSKVSWNGWKVFATPQISRPADGNQVTLLEYDETIYYASAGQFQADPRNGYAPDLSLTPPPAPTGLAIFSISNVTNADGSTSGQVVVRAAAMPTGGANLYGLITDTLSGEIYQGELLLDIPSGLFQATISGMRPNRPCTYQAWAVSSGGVSGIVGGPVPFTTLDYPVKPVAPATVAVTQKQSFEVVLSWSAALDQLGKPPVRRYVVFEKVGAGAFAEVSRASDLQYVRTNVTHGTTYQYKIHTEDAQKNESDDSSTVTVIPAAVINDNYIVGQGIGTPSIANNAVSQSRSYTGTASQSGSIPAGSMVSVGGSGNTYAFTPALATDAGGTVSYIRADFGGSPPTDSFLFYIDNPGVGAKNYYGLWRKFNP